ncbi:hypothetical protein [Pseudomonas sp. 22 E 5]|nr:hypothetical protein [Pseudomonas sp. 22 E 5]CRM97546.1 hypothetical protein [Pseudomonas sp. 22 E 5]
MALSSFWVASQRQARAAPGPMPLTSVAGPLSWPRALCSACSCSLQSSFGRITWTICALPPWLSVISWLSVRVSSAITATATRALAVPTGVTRVITEPSAWGSCSRVGCGAGRFQNQKPPPRTSASSTTKANTYRQERRIISVSPIQSSRPRSGRRYRPVPPADPVRRARPCSGVPSRAGTCL